ncbi:hypothetical protein AQUCO_00300693v1 [Aquilegia coerulea]|uniref:FLZ-type domain-containing protein n=1 Tax=Aquilegia coerulea TaxID=218851 RepID=A0A2G5EZY4_AQUCA|nr:hypothetical protein AQUCO_00300693v1 [Aquilegia coerulea]
MVGLSILLEAHQKRSSTVTTTTTSTKNPQVINKTISIKPSLPSSSSSSSPPLYPSSLLPSLSFLDSCFLCKQRILPGKDIYMYKGDRAFCSVECRCRQIFMDEESINVSREKKKCSFAAMRPINTSTSSSSSSSSSSTHQRKGNKNRANGFAY